MRCATMFSGIGAPEAAVATAALGWATAAIGMLAGVGLEAFASIAALLIEILEIYKWVVIAAVIVSWLVAFNVINSHNNFVRTVLRILYTLTEPVFRQIRRVIPPISGLDLSPIIVFVIIWFLQYTVQYLSFRGTI